MRDTLQELARERNAMRLKLWADDAFAHRWMCHPERECEDGCNVAANLRV